ncbi:helicase C-terminal domain-containing protein [Agrilactobacillus fermenti]|uniref:helicase C-terminal domain-containing protein n=1 Tax=Agrilactobacillus fermenti TaxID=2586909 RepID=UPI001E64B975|nr:helicase C-terminal domain-containing protein [Agrilactobacillus fermenti]MCD2255843.1 DEAD/DEAH box helicase [Agrilactobacillus fermenti]
MFEQHQIFSIVDLETTGTKRNEDQIIQFGCAQVQHGKVVNTISQNIQPTIAIPPAITDLTGINQAQVREAPTFAEIGPALHNMLMDTVFVAHNVNFDFPFINHAFESIGLPALDIPAIDTVELAQILLPTAVSFKLQDLSSLLSITHKNPHHADSDAIVTAKLFITLTKRLRQLPGAVLDELVRLGDLLSQQTGKYIQSIRDNQKRVPLPNYLHETHGIILRNKPQVTSRSLKPLGTYPKSPAAKKKLLLPILEYRSSQAKMMNQLHDLLSSQASRLPLIIEAPTGSGKTLGYLLPSYFAMETGQQVVISTATTVLQNQLRDQGIPLVEELLGTKAAVALIKSARHYLDLDVFWQTLQLPSMNRPTRLLQMRILVWLTMTKTGDLSELQLTKNRSHFLNRLVTTEVNAKSEFGNDNFYNYAVLQAQNAELIITNHAFLLHHEAFDSIKTHSALIIDEADAFIDQLEHFNKFNTNFKQFIEISRDLQSVKSQLQSKLTDIYPAVSKINRAYDQLEQIQTQINALQQVFFASYIEDNVPRAKRSTPIDITIDLHNLDIETYIKPPLAIMATAIQKLPVNFVQALNQLTNMQAHFDKATQNLFDRVYSLIGDFVTAAQQLQRFIAIFNSGTFIDQGTILSMRQYTDVKSLEIAVENFDNQKTVAKLFAAFDHVALTGATLTFNHRFDYFISRLGYEFQKTDTLQTAEPAFKTLKVASAFDFANQAKLITLTDSPDIKQTNNSYLADYITTVLNQIGTYTDGKVLVLFNALDLVKQTYYILKDTPFGRQRELLAQGITGSNEKLLKRFMINDQALLLGSNAFLTGIDLPGDMLQLVIMTRLPFESPDQPEVRLRYDWLKRHGKNPFRTDALPRAAMHLNQGFGRLIRTKTDRGIMLVLDTRLNSTHYGQQMLRSLPKSLPVLAMPLHEAVATIHNFFARS